MPTPPVVVVTGANGFVGAAVCRALAERGATVRAVVRRAGTAPEGSGEAVGDFADPDFAASVVAGATAVVTTVHPLHGDRATQHRIAVEGTPVIARAAADAGVPRLVHVSTASVYDRSPAVGDVDESSALVADDADDYSVTKRDTDLALEALAGITRVLLRPPAILGPGPTSTWNTLVPGMIREHEAMRHAIPERTYAWVHVTDLAALTAGLALGEVTGPAAGGCTVANVAAPRATQRDYIGAVTAALGVEAVWDDGPAWTGALVADRARDWGWSPAVDLATALAEVAADLSS